LFFQLPPGLVKSSATGSTPRRNGFGRKVHRIASAELTMARIAVLSAGESFGHDATTESKPRRASPDFCEAICEGLSEFPNEFELFSRFETSTAHHFSHDIFSTSNDHGFVTNEAWQLLKDKPI
jgi:hypothetical protein